jgi:hypothetical protein
VGKVNVRFYYKRTSQKDIKIKVMKKISIGILVLVAIVFYGCNKETVDPPIDPYALFKGQSHDQFRGKALGEDIIWIYDNWNNGTGSMTGYFWPLSENRKIQQSYFSIYDYEQKDFFNLIAMRSPAYCVDSSYVFKKSIFDVGIKTFHLSKNTIYEGFELTGNTKTGHFVTSLGEQDSSSFEIIKTQELPPNSPLKDTKRLRIWILVSCNLYDFDALKIGSIKDGQIIADIDLVYIE